MNIITRKKVPVEVEGTLPSLNTKAPDFSLENLDQKNVTLDSLKGKKVLISVFPDINTRVCDLQTRHFFKDASKHKDTTIINISNNTPEELSNWCAVAGVEAEMLSDVDTKFAKAYGVWIPSMNVLARSIFVLDTEGNLVYQELVADIATQPNYDAAFKALDAL